MKIQSYNRFCQQIHKSAKEKGFPLRVMFELTYRCNFKCKHCYVPESYKRKSKQELKTEEIFFILEQLADIGCLYLGFTGGEPFLRKDIFDVLWYAKKKGFQIIIYTNGSLIDKEEAQELKRLNPNKVDITIPAMSKTAFERISGAAGSRDRVFKAVELLYKKGVKLGFKTCLLKENEDEMKDIENFATSLEAFHRLDTMLSRRLDGSEEPYRYRGKLRENPLPRNSFHVTRGTSYDSREDCNFGVEKKGTERRTPNTEHLFKCGVGLNQVAINPFGELKMCVAIDYPKYKILGRDIVTGHRSQVTGQGNGLKQAWERLKSLVSEIKPDKNYQCDKCQLYNYCKWCPARSWLYNRSFTTCDQVSRLMAESIWQKIKGRKK